MTVLGGQYYWNFQAKIITMMTTVCQYEKEHKKAQCFFTEPLLIILEVLLFLFSLS